MGELHLYKREEENEEKSQAATWSSRGPCMTTELSSGDWGVLKVFWEEERPYCFFSRKLELCKVEQIFCLWLSQSSPFIKSGCAGCG